MNEVLGPDGKEIPDGLCVKYNGKLFPYRQVGPKLLNVDNDRFARLGLATQMGDQFNLILLAFHCLAKDVYSRDPKGSKEFLDFAKQIKMNIIDKSRNEIDIAAELEKIVGS